MLKNQKELDLSNLTVGELLKKKAEDGVRVLLMIWGETTSIMGTHDTETENYFKGNCHQVFIQVVFLEKENRFIGNDNGHYMGLPIGSSIIQVFFVVG